jgi:aryl-alcohol dehydrogenase-like predicted oxidoreductase
MQLPGKGVFGPPADREQALAVLRRVVDAGVDHIDTAQFYGPDVANELIHEALHPYPENLVIVSKVGATRDDQGAWLGAQRPDELRVGVEANLRTLEVDQVPVVNLRIHPGSDVPFDEQVDAMISFKQEGLIGGIGLSAITLDHYQKASSKTAIACVQNAYSVVSREDQDLFDACVADGVAFVPFFPLGSAFMPVNPVLESAEVNEIASRHGATPAQIALAWLLQAAPEVLLIPGTSSVAHLEENLAVADIALDAEAISILDNIELVPPHLP